MDGDDGYDQQDNQIDLKTLVSCGGHRIVVDVP